MGVELDAPVINDASMEANFTNIQHWNHMPKGGHFAAFEQPELFVAEVREFFRTLRKPPVS